MHLPLILYANISRSEKWLFMYSTGHFSFVITNIQFLLWIWISSCIFYFMLMDDEKQERYWQIFFIYVHLITFFILYEKDEQDEIINPFPAFSVGLFPIQVCKKLGTCRNECERLNKIKSGDSFSLLICISFCIHWIAGNQDDLLFVI